jgi:hypothetical protein
MFCIVGLYGRGGKRFRVHGFRVQGSGFRGFRGFRVQGSWVHRFKVQEVRGDAK